MAARLQQSAGLGTIGAVVTLIGTFLPWLRSGARNRSSYTIFELVDRLGFAPGGVVSASLRMWPIVPLVLVIAVVALWVPLPGRVPGWPVMIAVGSAAAWIGGTGVAVLLAPTDGLLRTGPGPVVTIVGTVLLGVGAAVRRRGSAASAAA
ncbi:MAG: hypothetical protein ABIP17_06975 [Ilumatobacteraceae bacterium]